MYKYINKYWVFKNQSRVQEEGHNEDRVADNGLFNKLLLFVQL